MYHGRDLEYQNGEHSNYLHAGVCTSWGIVGWSYCWVDCRSLGEEASPLACRDTVLGWVPDDCSSPLDRRCSGLQDCVAHREAAEWSGVGMVLHGSACELNDTTLQVIARMFQYSRFNFNSRNTKFVYEMGMHSTLASYPGSCAVVGI